MVSLTAYTWLDIILLLIAVAYIYLKWRFNHWKRKGLPYLEPASFIGNDPLRKKLTLGLLYKTYYDKLKAQGHKHGGIFIFTRPVYIIVHPDMVKSVLAKDFQHFGDRGIYYNETADPLSAHLVSIAGDKWRNLRAKLTPTFTSGKMKMMFQTLVQCSNPLIEAMGRYAEEELPIDIKEVLGCFTTDIIGSCAFGLECNSFGKEESPFRKHSKNIFSFSNKADFLRLTVTFTFPDLAHKLNLRFFSKELNDFFLNTVRSTIEYREKNNIKRNDFLELLLEIKNSTKEKDGLTLEQITANSFMFFFAGYETSSTTMSFCLYELSVNPEIQKKLRHEVREVVKKHNGELTYEGIQEMKYLGQVIDETLRKYPPLPHYHRKCTMDYSIPDTDVVLKKGERVTIPVMGLQYDPEYFPDPDVFDPERFSEENKQSVIPYTYLPFGEGPRSCIGARFGYMQTKVGIAALLKNFEFSLHEKTQQPIELDIKSIILTTKGGLWLKAKKIA